MSSPEAAHQPFLVFKFAMAIAEFRLRARHQLDVPVAERVLGSIRRRRAAPSCWAWAWPLASEEASVPPPPLTTYSSWLADVRAAAVADDGGAIALVSTSGKVILAIQRSDMSAGGRASPVVGEEDSEMNVPVLEEDAPAPTTSGAEMLQESGFRVTALKVEPSRLHDCDPDSGVLFLHATSVALFHVADQDSSAVDLVIAVGYDSGAVAFFDGSSGSVCAATRPVSGQPVRRLRFVPSFHILDPVSTPALTSEYPYPTADAGLFCVFGWSGVVGRLPTTAIVDAMASRRFDIRGGGWILWRLQSQDAVVDAIPCSSEPNAVCELDPPPSEAALRVVAGGINPPLAAFACGSMSAFSARDVARKAATAVFSAAKGAVVSRLSSFVPRFGAAPPPPPTPEGNDRVGGAAPNAGDEDDDTGKSALSASVRASLSWSDEPDASSPLLRFGLQDMSNTARKSMANLLARRHARIMGTTDTAYDAGDDGASAALARRTSVDIGAPPSSAAAAALPQNIRLIQRCASAPLPCTLFATCDTLGRVFIMDARDLCVIRMLKGYRDAHVAWVARGGPVLAVLAPRRSIVELHNPLEAKRLAAFEVEPGSLLVQSTSFSVFTLAPSGILYEFAPARKPVDRVGRHKAGAGPSEARSPEGEGLSTNGEQNPRTATAASSTTAPANESMEDVEVIRQPPSNSTVSLFIEHCKAGRTSHAAGVLESAAEEDLQHMAHLMALLVCTRILKEPSNESSDAEAPSYVRSQVHVALASRAARLAADAGNADLEVRYEAHSRLAEAFGLLAVDVFPGTLGDGASTLRLESDDAFASCLHNFDDLSTGSHGRVQKRDDDDLVNCERFILAHVLLPSVPDTKLTGSEYVLRPRDDLSEGERIWLARAYFARLVAVDEKDVLRGSDPEPTSSRDVYLALRGVLGYSVEQVLSHFLDFFLWSPVEELLQTPLRLEQSGLRYALNRLRSLIDRAMVDDNIIHACENTTRIANAMLLVRLCVVHEGAGSASVDPRYLALLEQLIQAVRLRADLVGSKAESAVKGRITARHFQGSGGEAERQAVSLLAEGGEDVRATAVLAGLSQKRPALEWHEAASVSEVGLQIARRRLASLFDEKAYASIAPNVASWIQEGEEDKKGLVPIATGESPRGTPTSSHADELRGIQNLLLAAHEHFPDTSIDTIRCLQLAEAIASLLREFAAAKDAEAEATAEGGESVEIMEEGDGEMVDGGEDEDELDGDENGRDDPMMGN